MSSTVAAPRRRRRRVVPVLIAVLLLLLLLAAVALVVGDRVFRDRAEQEIATRVEASLPEGVEGRVVAEVQGFSALQQYASGEFDHVTLRSRGLEVAGAPASGVVQLRGLPADGAGTIDRAVGELTVDQAAFTGIAALRQANATDPRLLPGRVTTTVRQEFLGLPVRIDVQLSAALRGQVVQLTPEDAVLRAGPAQVPATAIVKQVLPQGVRICAAEYLPRPVSLTSIRLQRGAVRVGLAADDVDLASLSSGETGTCAADAP